MPEFKEKLGEKDFKLVNTFDGEIKRDEQVARIPENYIIKVQIEIN